ncbi:hypothetical protein C8Q80DRAFT_1244393 [Daedaleopsis nitida]|nr:hypothetical protein C8Q80DRAFT_1244393 [Daedaleopsis nitida]
MATIDSPARSPTSQQSPSSGATGDGNESYPPQLHAGAVGYGPEYGKGASTGDKFQGLKEEMKGKMFHKPDLVQHGRDLRTGELKNKQDDDANPFNPAGDDKNSESEHEETQAATTAPEGTAKSERQTEGENSDRVSHIG